MSTLPVLFGNLGAVIGLSDRLHDIAGRIERVAELQEVLDEVEERQAEDRAAERAKSTAAAAANGGGGGGGGGGEPEAGLDLMSLVHSPARQEYAEKHEGVAAASAAAAAGGAEIRFESADIVTPNGDAIAVGLDVCITPGNSVMVTGD